MILVCDNLATTFQYFLNPFGFQHCCVNKNYEKKHTRFSVAIGLNRDRFLLWHLWQLP